MVHSGYEASAVDAIYSSFGGFLATVKATLFSRYRDDEALRMLDEPVAAVHPLVQIEVPRETLHETQV